MPRPWAPTPFMKASAVLHVAAGGALAIVPASWPWALGALVANHLAITTAGLLPRSQCLGKTITRIPDNAAARGAISITIDDGPDPEVTPRVLDLLDEHGACASFFCIGRRARQHPALCREIVLRGHSVENHGERHSSAFAFYGTHRMEREVREGLETLSNITGVAPRFYRSPAGLRNPFLDPVLARLDLELAAWTRRGYDTRNADANDVVARLLGGLAGGDILLLHDGNAARTASGQAVILDVLPRLLDQLKRASLHSLTLPQAFDER